MPRQEIEYQRGRIHIEKRPWRPPIKGQPFGPDATTVEIDGEEAPVVTDGTITRKLKPEETIDRRRHWNMPEVILASRDLREKTKEETDGSANESGFTKREIQVLQGLVDGLSKKQRAKALDISTEDIKTYERLIAEKLGVANRQDGLREAVVKGVMIGFLNTNSLPDEPEESLTVKERQVLVTMVRGFTTSQSCELLGISSRTLSTYRSQAHDKIGLHTQYQVLAWATRDMLIRGELVVIRP